MLNVIIGRETIDGSTARRRARPRTGGGGVLTTTTPVVGHQAEARGGCVLVQTRQ